MSAQTAVVAVMEKVDVIGLRSLNHHPRVRDADERLQALGQKRADAEADMVVLQGKQERLEAEAARRLDAGARIPTDVQVQLDEVREEIVQQAQVLRVLAAAVERERTARDAHLDEVQAEVQEELAVRYRIAVMDLDRALSNAAVKNESVTLIADAALRLGRHTYGAGRAGFSGIGTGGGNAVVTVSPLPDLAWRELSLRTSKSQPENRLHFWRRFVRHELGIKLDGSGEG